MALVGESWSADTDAALVTYIAGCSSSGTITASNGMGFLADRDFVYNRTAKGKARNLAYDERNRAARRLAKNLGIRLAAARELIESGWVDKKPTEE